MDKVRGYLSTIKDLVDGLWGIFNSLAAGVWVFLHEGVIIRRASLLAMWWLTFEAYHFCYRAAAASNWEPTAIGSCFAILTPVSALQAGVLKFYNDARRKDEV